MKTNQLKYFVEVARQANITHAAKALNVAQPSLSHAIRSLEERLGVTLFERQTTGMVLTPPGEKLYSHATKILKDIKDAKKEVMAMGKGQKQQVFIVLPANMARHLSARLMSQTREQLPHISLHIFYGLSSEAIGRLRTLDIDFGFVPEFSGAEEFICTEWYAEPLYVVGVPEFFQLNRKTISLVDVGRLPLVLTSPGNDIRDRVDKAARSKSIVLNIRYEEDHPDLKKNLVLDGLACTIVARHMFDQKALQSTLSAKKLTAPTLTRPLVVAWRKDRPLSEGARTVLKLLRTTIQQLHDKKIITGSIKNNMPTEKAMG